MSSPPSRQRSPMYYCYECNAEMRPLMVPDPHCASCNGTFVEEIVSENPDPASNPDDPRNFQQDLPFGGHMHDDGDGHSHFHVNDGPFPGGAAGADPIIHLMNMLMGGMPPTGQRPPSMGGGTTIRLDMGGGRGGNLIFTSGGGGGPSPLAGIVPGPTSGTPGSGSPRAGGAMPAHPLEGLIALLSGGRGMFPMGGPGMSGRMGDYVLDQHSLDEIITRLMEQSQGSQPVPAPDDMIANLPRQKVTAGSPLTEKECAVCKDTFEPSDDPVLTIQCSPNPKYQHTFHEDCIVPWLKQNGTCPVCRFQLVPQPEHHAPPPAPGTGPGPNGPSSGPSAGSSGPAAGGNGGGTARGGSGFSGFWDLLSGAAHNQGGGGSSTTNDQSSQQRPTSLRTNTRNGNRSPNPHPPGGWNAALD